MKRIFTHLSLAITVLLCIVSSTASAATPTPFTGPSDATSLPPATAAAVSKVYCAGSTITLTGPTFVTGYKYDWYKIDNTGASVLVKEGTTDNIYTETAAGAGYYNYKLVVINTADCSSPATGVNKVFVLPALTLNIPTAGPICSGGQTNTTLALDQPLPIGYTYTYQWYRNNIAIATAAGTAGTTYQVTETTATGSTPINYHLVVKFALNTSCSSQSNDAAITVVDPPATPTITFN